MKKQDPTDQSEQLLSSVLNSLSAHIAVIDSQGTIIRVNKAWKSFKHFNVGENYLELFETTTGLLKKPIIDNIKKVLNRELQEFHIEYQIIEGDTEHWYLLQATPLVENNSGAVIAHTDITQRIQLEKHKDEFLSIASHELKTPLTTIKGYIQLLQKYLEKEGAQKPIRYVNLADLYVDKLNHLISSLLDISRIQSGRLILRPETIELSALIKNIVETMQYLSSRHHITFHPKQLLLVDIDYERIEQVLMNLISNAVKFSPEATDVEVTVDTKSEHAIIAITDHGIGIANEHMDQLFQRFTRVKNPKIHSSGLGIGLYLSSEIINRHGGKIWVESNEGQGSTFYFTLPLHK